MTPMSLPNPQVHFDHAAHNERLLDVLEGDLLPRHPEFLDWAIVVTFYAALHYTKAALIRDHHAFAPHHRGYRDEHGVLHDGNNDLVHQHFELDVRTAYKELFDRAQEARYRPLYRKRDSLGTTQQLALYRVHLETIKAACT
jgi:hypothetical protein